MRESAYCRAARLLVGCRTNATVPIAEIIEDSGCNCGQGWLLSAITDHPLR
jgi:hypothetical protein